MQISQWPLLPMITFLPILGALLLLLAPSGGKSEDDVAGELYNIKLTALWISVVTLLLSLLLVFLFDSEDSDYQFIFDAFWLSSSIRFRMGIDGISLVFIVLTAFLIPLCILSSWHSISTRVRDYLIAFLVLEGLMIGVFCSLDLIWFYLFFEGGLIPMFLIIGIWGGSNRVYASFKFFLFTFLGSVLMLLAIMAMYVEAGTTDIVKLQQYDFSYDMQLYLFLAFFASFAVKLPMWPFHTWLPDAHVEAPTAGSVILAGILLKMGGYGFLRFSLPMFPLASEYFALMIFVLSLIAIIYASLVALVQEDIKKLVAYSSIAHMGFVTMGIFTLTHEGIQGAVFQMVSHGIVSGALFLCVGVLYSRMHTRRIDAFGGLVKNMPVYAFIFMIFTMANIGLPGTSGFVGEFLTLLAAYSYSPTLAFIAAIGIILSACYGLWLYRRVIFGSMNSDVLRRLGDLSRLEVMIFAPLVILTILFGIYPSLVLGITEVSVDALVDNISASIGLAEDVIKTAVENN